MVFLGGVWRVFGFLFVSLRLNVCCGFVCAAAVAASCGRNLLTVRCFYDISYVVSVGADGFELWRPGGREDMGVFAFWLNF